MREQRERDPVADHLAQIILRIRQVEALTERFGPTRGRERQYAALEWALDELRDLYPESAARSVGIADRLSRLIADNLSRRSEEHPK